MHPAIPGDRWKSWQEMKNVNMITALYQSECKWVPHTCRNARINSFKSTAAWFCVITPVVSASWQTIYPATSLQKRKQENSESKKFCFNQLVDYKDSQSHNTQRAWFNQNLGWDFYFLSTFTCHNHLLNPTDKKIINLLAICTGTLELQYSLSLP